MHDQLRKVVTVLFIAIWIFAIGSILRLTTNSSPGLLAYPGPPTSAPYPGPNTPTPYAPGPVNSSPWPSPTAHTITPDPSLTPRPRHGMAAAFADRPFRPDMSEWTYIWSPFPNQTELMNNTIPMLHGAIYEGG